MAELRLPPGPLERALGQLIEAGLAQPEDLATFLGLEPRHVARPLRKLSREGALDGQPDDVLKLTPEGRTWLAIEPIVPGRDAAAVRIAPAAPRLSPLRLEPGEELLSLARQDFVTVGKPSSGWRRHRLSRPWVRMPAATLHRLAAVAAAATILVTGFASGVLQRGLAATGLLGYPFQVQAAEESNAVPLTTSSDPFVSSFGGQWMLVQYTEGLGLALRPEPASAERLRTLPEGARVRITGEAVEAAGRSWIPVEALGDELGWVAAEFLVATS
jgi:hypothetical protein